MKTLSRLLLPTLLLGAPLALAEGTPATPPQAAAPQATAPTRTIDVSFRGSLRDALKTIAEKGGLNLVVTGDLDTPAEVRLRGIGAEQALRTVARAYSLHLEQDGSIFTLRPLTAREKEAGTAANAPTPTVAPVPPAPPMMAATPPPAPPAPDEDQDEDAADARREAAEARAEAARERAEAAREEADQVKERVREEMQRARESIRRGKRGARDVVARGQNLEVKEGESVESAVVYGGNLIVRGTVEDDAVAFGGNLEIHGHVEGDAHAFGGNVILGPDAQVDGDVSAFGGQVQKEAGARVEGSTESFGGAGLGRMVAGEIKRGMHEVRDPASANADNDDDGDERESRGDGLASFILQFALLFGLGFLGQMFFPARMKELGEEIRGRPGKVAFVGVVGMLALIPLTVVLCITLIGIPVAFALLVASMLGTALGYAAIASELGTRFPVLRGRKTQAGVLALGLALLLLVSHIPVLGVLLNLFLIPLAFGAVIRTRFGYRPRGMPEPIFPRNEAPV